MLNKRYKNFHSGKSLISSNHLFNIFFLTLILIPLFDTFFTTDIIYLGSQDSSMSNVSKWPLSITFKTCLRMLKVVDKQVILVFKQVVIVETMTTTKERPFTIYSHLFLLSGFSFTNIHDSQDSRRRGRLFL